VRSFQQRVFISSVIDNFELYRTAAADGIRAANGEPVRINEDFPSLPDSSRNACLDAIATCDAFVLLLGDRAGWKSPSGRFVIEEEYDEAIRIGLPVFVFLEEITRNGESQVFADRISDYVLGTFRRTFQSPDDLKTLVRNALNETKSVPGRDVTSDIADALAAKGTHSNLPMLRLALASVRNEDLIDPLTLLRTDYQDAIIRVATTEPYPLFGLRKAKAADVRGKTLALTQSDDRGSHGAEWQSMVLLGHGGLLAAETSIGSHEQLHQSYNVSTSMTVVTNDLVEAARSLLQFANQLFAFVDPYYRHRQLQFNVAIHGLDFRTIVDAKPTSGQGVPMRMMGGALVTAYDEPRAITREALSNPNEEIDRAVQFLKHRSG